MISVASFAVSSTASPIPAFSRHFGQIPIGASGGSTVPQSGQVLESLIGSSPRDHHGVLTETSESATNFSSFRKRREQVPHFVVDLYRSGHRLCDFIALKLTVSTAHPAEAARQGRRITQIPLANAVMNDG